MEGKHKITITIEELPIRLNAVHYSSEFLLELITPLHSIKSKPIPAQVILNQPFEFPFPEDPPEEIILRVHHNKNLEYVLVGDFRVKVPREGSTIHGEWPNNRSLGHMEGKVGYERVSSKFRMIKNYKA